MALTATTKAALVSKINSLDTFEVKPFAMPAFDAAQATNPVYLMEFAQNLTTAKAKHDAESGAPTEAAQVRFACASLFASLFPSSGSLDDKELGEQMSLFRSMVINRIGVHHFTESEFSLLLTDALRGNAGGLTTEKAKHYISFLDAVKNREEERNFSSSYKSARLTKSFADLLVSGIKLQDSTKEKAELEKSTLTYRQALEAISKGETPWKVVVKVEPEVAPIPSPSPSKPTANGKGGKAGNK